MIRRELFYINRALPTLMYNLYNKRRPYGIQTCMDRSTEMNITVLFCIVRSKLRECLLNRQVYISDSIKPEYFIMYIQSSFTERIRIWREY